MGAQTTNVMNTPLSDAEANFVLQQVDHSDWWKQKLRFDSQTVFTLGLDEKIIHLDGKIFHLPCINLGDDFVDQLSFTPYQLSLTASFKVIEGDILEPVPFEQADFALRVEVPYNIIYIVQRKKGLLGKEETIYRN